MDQPVTINEPALLPALVTQSIGECLRPSVITRPFLNKRYLSKRYALERDTSHSLEKRAEHLGVCRRREGNLFYRHVRSCAFLRASVYFFALLRQKYIKKKQLYWLLRGKKVKYCLCCIALMVFLIMQVKFIPVVVIYKENGHSE